MNCSRQKAWKAATVYTHRHSINLQANGPLCK